MKQISSSSENMFLIIWGIFQWFYPNITVELGVIFPWQRGYQRAPCHHDVVTLFHLAAPLPPCMVTITVCAISGHGSMTRIGSISLGRRRIRTWQPGTYTTNLYVCTYDSGIYHRLRMYPCDSTQVRGIINGTYHLHPELYIMFTRCCVLLCFSGRFKHILQWRTMAFTESADCTSVTEKH